MIVLFFFRESIFRQIQFRKIFVLIERIIHFGVGEEELLPDVVVGRLKNEKKWVLGFINSKSVNLFFFFEYLIKNKQVMIFAFRM